MKLCYLCFILLCLQACSSFNGRYLQRYDSTPVRLPSSTELQDPTPRIEPKSAGGNTDYSVLGKDYKVLSNVEHFTQQGIASWYGNKFHGHLTSNGEIYNMYSMSAAHKSLPLPTYVKVTNLDNNKTVIVRVNDRGPFHKDRIIDLSYSAAYKLDMLKTGTAHVKLEAITADYLAREAKAKQQELTAQKLAAQKLAAQQLAAQTETQAMHSQTPVTDTEKQLYIQVFATRSELLAKNTANGLGTLYQLPVSWPKQDGIYRIQIGPIDDEQATEQLLDTLKKNGYPQAYKKLI